ncbi:YojF family protein [Bacillus tianshenii]|nr:YojF family protein [Bacillus tianshenii]
MEKIQADKVQQAINAFNNKEVYIHLETTNGAYANFFNEKMFSAGAFIRNVKLTYSHGKITGEGPFRVGLKLNGGWVYAEGLTHWEVDEKDRLLLAGHSGDGKLAAALEISETPFD